ELQLDPQRIEAIAASPVAFTGRTAAQVQAVVHRVSDIVAAHPEAASYSPARIL
ncbi:MAG: adenylosuccinate lyase, partial [Acidimicrobiia bacterium]